MILQFKVIQENVPSFDVNVLTLYKVNTLTFLARLSLISSYFYFNNFNNQFATRMHKLIERHFFLVFDQAGDDKSARQNGRDDMNEKQTQIRLDELDLVHPALIPDCFRWCQSILTESYNGGLRENI